MNRREVATLFNRKSESGALEMARLEGESSGRLFGKIDERRLIVEWLSSQAVGTPKELAHLINLGAHARSTT